ncbi:MAG: hypothetical protein M1826_001559 [Phylliscum demangeonii]|nr:MAG: hypothetical protein M1826_001559 [Phylliscum demangeonii]
MNEDHMMERIVSGLNSAQRAAVTSPAAALQILAPPGSGKTKTLTARVAYLLRHDGFRPQDIIVATFTVKAAREMKERLAVLLGDGLESKLVLGTFHSIARRYLVRYGHLIGLRRSFGIADSSDSAGIIKRIVKLRRTTLDARTAQNRISSAKAKGQRRIEPNSEGWMSKELASIFDEYQETLDRSNLLDYDDLLLRALDLLRQFPNCVSNVQAVLIDEFQDTNLVQFELMTLFAARRRRVTIVGDPDQSIYSFRHAEVENLGKMAETYEDAMAVFLEQNYRSSGAILHSALEVIQQDKSRPPKTLIPTHDLGSSPVLKGLDSAEHEADWLVAEIRRSMVMTGNVLSPNDYAILLRSAYLSRHIELSLGRAGIPYRMVGSRKFFERLEVKIVMDFLRVISSPDNSDALARIINVPPRRVGQVTVKKLFAESEAKKITLWELVQDYATGAAQQIKITHGVQRALASFVELMCAAQRKIAGADDKAYTLVELMEYVISAIDLDGHLQRAHPTDYESRSANIQELVAQASEFSESVNGRMTDADQDEEELPVIDGVAQNASVSMSDTLSRFIANLTLSTDLSTKGPKDGPPPEQVTVCTIHAAKGLEWPVVFVPGVYEGSIPHSRAENTDEERRLLYVAMTRAKALLYMSFPDTTSQGESAPASSFLTTKALEPLLDRENPRLKYGDVQSICRILGRPTPTQGQITKAVEQLNRSIVESRKRRWANAMGGDGGGGAAGQESYPDGKRGRVIWPKNGGVVRIAGSETDLWLSALAARPPPSFVTARTHLRNMTQEALNRPPNVWTAAARAVETGKLPTAAKAAPTQRGRGRGRAAATTSPARHTTNKVAGAAAAPTLPDAPSSNPAALQPEQDRGREAINLDSSADEEDVKHVQRENVKLEGVVEPVPAVPRPAEAPSHHSVRKGPFKRRKPASTITVHPSGFKSYHFFSSSPAREEDPGPGTEAAPANAMDVVDAVDVAGDPESVAATTTTTTTPGTTAPPAPMTATVTTGQAAPPAPSPKKRQATKTLGVRGNGDGTSWANRGKGTSRGANAGGGGRGRGRGSGRGRESAA